MFLINSSDYQKFIFFIKAMFKTLTSMYGRQASAHSILNTWEIAEGNRCT